jgi:hypothetical protein
MSGNAEAHLKLDILKKNDYSEFFFSNSIKAIISFEYDESVKLDDFSTNNSDIIATNPSPGVSVPSNISDSTYESKIMNLKKEVESYKEEIANIRKNGYNS